MAYRRKSGGPRSVTFEDFRPFTDESSSSSSSSSMSSSSYSSSLSPSAPSIATQAIRASAAHRDSSLSSAYGESAFSAATRRDHDRNRKDPQDSNVYEYTSMNIMNEPKTGLWDVLTRKAKGRLDEGNAPQKFEENGIRSQMLGSTNDQPHSRWSAERYRKTEIPSTDAIASSLKGFGGTIKNAFGEGLTMMENKTAGIIQETKKLQMRKKTGSSFAPSQSADTSVSSTVSLNQTDYETQLKASRDVANAMAAKAKLLLRELKTVRADLAFAKERCSQLEEENKILRESRQKGDNPADDDLIRLQLETLLAEKARLAQENSIYARENRFLREIVEYHQLTMQDVVYFNEGTEDVVEVYPQHEVTGHSSPSHSEPENVSPVLSPNASPVQSLPSEVVTSLGSPRSVNIEPQSTAETSPKADTILKGDSSYASSSSADDSFQKPFLAQAA